VETAESVARRTSAPSFMPPLAQHEAFQRGLHLVGRRTYPPVSNSSICQGGVEDARARAQGGKDERHIADAYFPFNTLPEAWIFQGVISVVGRSVVRLVEDWPQFRFPGLRKRSLTTQRRKPRERAALAGTENKLPRLPSVRSDTTLPPCQRYRHSVSSPLLV
jgi:hypothetical protein